FPGLDWPEPLGLEACFCFGQNLPLIFCFWVWDSRVSLVYALEVCLFSDFGGFGIEVDLIISGFIWVVWDEWGWPCVGS
ncbi:MULTISPECIES: hypothetical protein, partial [Bacillus]